MLIAHLPAGYLLTRRIAPRLAASTAVAQRLIVVGLAASVFPDIDLVYFYLGDGRRTLHHDYWTHIPAFWPVLALAVIALMRLARLAIPWREILVFLAGIFLHLALDTISGGILWAWPASQHRFLLIDVPARFDWWVWNFVLHWSFLLELAILALAARELRIVAGLRNLKQFLPARIVSRTPTNRSGKTS